MKSIDKKQIVISGILLFVGIVIGVLFFGGNSSMPTTSEDAHKETTVAKKQFYTCSMHPQIHQDHPGDCPICGMELIPENSSSDDEEGDYEGAIKISEKAQKLSNIQTTTIGMKSGKVIVATQGKIEIAPDDIFSQVSHVAGRIEKLYVVNNYQYVKKGAALYVIYSPRLLQAEEELIQAIAYNDRSLEKGAIEKLENVKISQAHINRVKTEKKATGFYTVVADFSGYITMQMKSVGDYVKEGEKVYQFSTLKKIWATFDVYQKDIKSISKGDSVYMYTSDSYEKVGSKIAYISPVSEKNSTIFKVTALINAKKFLPGMVVNGDVINETKKPVLYVPKSAVMWTGKRSVVYIKHPNSTAFEMREVLLGDEFDEGYFVKSGLTMNDEVVTNGVFAVDAASQLAGKKSMMNREKGATPVMDHGGMKMDSDVGKTEKSSKVTKPKVVLDREKADKLYKSYLEIKNSLAKDDEATAKGQVKKFTKLYMSFNSSNDAFMKLVHQLKSASTIKEMRIDFKPFSSQFIEIMKTSKISNKAYIQFCPMFDNNKGAYWLSDKEQIENPFYGSKMMKCGEVKGELGMISSKK